MMFYSIIQLLLISLPVSLSYDSSQCPMPWEWELRGKGYCNSSKDYSCLFNEITNKSEESCRFKAHELKLGEQYVLRLSPEGELCTNNAKYQPFKLNRLQTECTFARSKCKEPGQVVFHRGNASKDTTCRCNFNEGWSFVSRPKALCFCEPSEEDCTCHLNICPSRYVLTPDYQCVNKIKLNYMSFSCPDMNPQRNNSYGKTLSRIKQIIDEPIQGRSHSMHLIVSTVYFIVCILCLVVAGLLIILEKLPSFCYYQISHPTNLTYDTETGSLILTWTKPPLKQKYIHGYKVASTLNEWKDIKTFLVDRNKSSCEIADILPLKTYRFTIRSFLENSFESECSDEIIYISPGPNRPQTLHSEGIRGNIKLMWTAPVASVLRIDAYCLEISIAEKAGNETKIKLPSDNLEYLIENVVEDVTYRFKIYSISKEKRSPATEDSYYTGLSHQITLPIVDSEDGKDLNNVNSTTYRTNVNALESGVCEEYKTVEGEQTVLNPKFWKGSFYASFILVSKGFYDQKMLQTVMEHAVNKGIFGRLKVSKDGFFIKALNYPVPPTHITTEIYDRNVKVSWSEPAKTFFKPEGFIIQYTTDKWETCKENMVPEDEHQLIINVESPSVILQVKIYTYIKSSIRSLPSKEVNVELNATTRQTMDSQYKAMLSSFVEPKAFKEILQTRETNDKWKPRRWQDSIGISANYFPEN